MLTPSERGEGGVVLHRPRTLSQEARPQAERTARRGSRRGSVQDLPQGLQIRWVIHAVDHAMAVRAQPREVGDTVVFYRLSLTQAGEGAKVVNLDEVLSRAAIPLRHDE